MAAPNTRNAAASKPDKGGGVWRAPLGTVLPTDATTELSAEFEPLGYVSDAGVVPTRDTSIEKIKAWGGDIVAALLTDESRSFEFTLIERFSDAVQKFVHGAENVVVTPATASAGTKVDVVDKGGKPEQQVLVFKMRHGGKLVRVVVPVADPTITGEGPWTDGELNSYTVTVEALKDDSGARVYEYLENDDSLSA